jgi:MFS family permease
MADQTIISNAKKNSWVVSMVCIMITGISYGFGLFLLPMVIPEIVRDLGLDYTLIGIITGAGPASVFLSIPLAGFLTHQMGGLKLIVIIQAAGALFLAGHYFIQGFTSLFILNFLVRAWPVMTWIPLVSVAVEHIPEKWRATMLTMASGAACFFIFIDGWISSFFLEYFHWRTMWLAVAAICLISSLASFAALKSVGLWQTKTPEQKKIKNLFSGDLSRWLKSRSGITMNVIFLITGLSFATFQVYLAAFLRDELSISLDMMAMMWSAMGISGIFGGMLFGRFADSLGIRVTQFLIFLMGCSAAFFLILPVTVANLLAMAILFGVSQAAIYGMGPSYLSKVLSSRTASPAFTLGTMAMSFGAVLGNFFGGWSNNILDSFRLFYLTIGVLFICGGLLTLLLKSEK